MDKLLFYTLNNRGLPQGPNYERTSMLGKLTMFNNGGPVSGRPYLSVMPGMTGGIDLQAGTDFNIKDRVFGDINISNPIVAPNMQTGEYKFAPLNPNVSGRVAIPLQDMDIVGSFDTDFNQARLNASASMGFPKGDISGNIGTDLKNVYGGVDINYRPIDPLSLNYSLNADPSGVYHDIGASYDVNDNVNLYGNVSLTPQEPPAYRVGLRANFEHGGTHTDPPKTKIINGKKYIVTPESAEAIIDSIDENGIPSYRALDSLPTPTVKSYIGDDYVKQFGAHQGELSPSFLSRLMYHKEKNERFKKIRRKQELEKYQQYVKENYPNAPLPTMLRDELPNPGEIRQSDGNGNMNNFKNWSTQDSGNPFINLINEAVNPSMWAKSAELAKDRYNKGQYFKAGMHALDAIPAISKHPGIIVGKELLENLVLYGLGDVDKTVDDTKKYNAYADGGDVIDPGDGWQYLKEGNNYLTRKKGNTDWIIAKDEAKKAIQTRIFSEPIGNPLPQEQQISIENIDTPENFIQPNINRDTIAIQQKLFDAGYDLGTTGPLQNGVDGDLGPKTKAAIDAYNKGINPQDFKSQDLKMQNEIINQEYKEKPQTANYVTNIQKYLIGKGYEINESGVMDVETKNALKDYETSGKFATLPVFPSHNPREEECKIGPDGHYECSRQASNKLGNIFGQTSMPEATKNLWANNAWFNKSSVIKNGGTLLYETDIRGKDVPDLPKEVYGILQVGDYVHLDREGLTYDDEKDLKNKYDNEKVEHMGIIIGKDTDGTPLIWHSSEGGVASINRVDEPIKLTTGNQHEYKIASIARAGAMKDKYQDEILQNPYFKTIDKKDLLVPLEGANNFERNAINTINENMGTYLSAGYNQEDVLKAGQLLLGALKMESKRGQSTLPGGSIPTPLGFRIPLPETIPENPKRAGIPGYGERPGISPIEFKENLASIAQVFGLKKDEVSKGMYQMKINMHFDNEDMKEKLKAIGLTKDNILDSEENQTKAAALIMLNNYKTLKRHPDYNPRTDQLTITAEDGTKWNYPSEYILAGTWKFGPRFYVTDKHKKILTSFDKPKYSTPRSYADAALETMGQVVQTEQGRNYGKEGAGKYKSERNRIAGEKLDSELKEKLLAEGYPKEALTDKGLALYRKLEGEKALRRQDYYLKNEFDIAPPAQESTRITMAPPPNIKSQVLTPTPYQNPFDVLNSKWVKRS